MSKVIEKILFNFRVALKMTRANKSAFYISEIISVNPESI